MRVAIATTKVPFVYGGAEILAESLSRAIIAAGHECEIISIPFKWYPPEKILDSMLACRLLDLSESNGLPIDMVIGLKFPAYLIPHQKKVMWLVHQHRSAYELWDLPHNDLSAFSNGREIRDVIRHADTNIISGIEDVYTISQNVSQRLMRFNNIESKVLYPPPQNAEKFFCLEAESYVFFPSRLNITKRQELAIKALQHTDSNIKLIIAGTADNSETITLLKNLANKLKVSDRVVFLGSITEKEKFEYYAKSLAVIYPPYDEDYGYVTLEAMLSGKPVITCVDSGGPLEFIIDGENGYITASTPESVGDAINKLDKDRNRSKEMGQHGRERYKTLDISWNSVVEVLLK